MSECVRECDVPNCWTTEIIRLLLDIQKQNRKQREGVCSQLNPNDVYTAFNGPKLAFSVIAMLVHLYTSA